MSNTATSTPIKAKGRSIELVNRRNEYLMHRYYYYLKFTKLRYSCIMSNLTNELYISNSTLQDLINDNMSMFQQLELMNPRLRHFQDRYPHINWTITA